MWRGLPCWLSGKEPSCQYRRYRLDPWVGKVPWRSKREPTPVFLSEESHGQRSLVGYSLWGCKESDTTEWLHVHVQTMVEVMKIMVTSFRRSHACTYTLSTPNPAAGHHWPMPLLETPGHSWASLGQSLVGSLIFCPGSWYTQGSVCALQESISLSCVRSGSSMVGLMVTSFVTWEVSNHSFNFSTCDWSVQIFYFIVVPF